MTAHDKTFSYFVKLERQYSGISLYSFGVEKKKEKRKKKKEKKGETKKMYIGDIDNFIEIRCRLSIVVDSTN
jgi:hypothetical protein